MVTGLFSATMCSPMCKIAKYLRTADKGFDNFQPTESSTLYSAILIAFFSGMTLVSVISARKESNNERKLPVAALSAAIFSAGLFISGMTKNYKIYGFLDLKLLKKGKWDPTLICVMGSGLIFSAIGYHFVKGYNIFKVIMLDIEYNFRFE